MHRLLDFARQRKGVGSYSVACPFVVVVFASGCLVAFCSVSCCATHKQRGCSRSHAPEAPVTLDSYDERVFRRGTRLALVNIVALVLEGDPSFILPLISNIGSCVFSADCHFLSEAELTLRRFEGAAERAAGRRVERAQQEWQKVE